MCAFKNPNQGTSFLSRIYKQGLLEERIKQFEKRNSKSLEEAHTKTEDANRKLRQEYAPKVYNFMFRFSISMACVAIIFIFLVGFECLSVSAVPIATALVGVIPASMVLYGWILKGLFQA